MSGQSEGKMAAGGGLIDPASLTGEEKCLYVSKMVTITPKGRGRKELMNGEWGGGWG